MLLEQQIVYDAGGISIDETKKNWIARISKINYVNAG